MATAIENWTLVKVPELSWIQDNSTLYGVIYAMPGSLVRVDIMSTLDDVPMRSYVGKANDVRKAIARDWPISAEHASYIGYELARAELQGSAYVQG